ncbi:MAG: 3-oxoacyl-[acyl-carrier-protein] reductase [Sphingomonadales bacterium]
MIDLTGKRALVTGASGDIGAAIASQLSALGAVVGLSGTREEKLAEVAATLPGETHILPANLSDPEAVSGLIPAAIEAMGGIDILVNNAGITRDGLAMRMKADDWDAVVAVNMTAAFQLAQACLRSMMKQRAGRIINISSVVGAVGNPGQANYVASKAGMVGWTKALAAEVASRNITVNCVAPGFIATAMTDVLSDEQKEKLSAQIPAGRLGSGADVAGAVAYLASDAASYLTGQTLHVNGGMAML